MDAEERSREINMLKFHIDRLMIECVKMVVAVRRIAIDQLVLSGGGSVSAATASASGSGSSSTAASNSSSGGGFQFSDKALFPERSLSALQRENAVAEELRTQVCLSINTI